MEEEDSRRAFFGEGRREPLGARGGGGCEGQQGARAKGQEPKVKGVRSTHPTSPRTLSVRS